MEQLENRMVTDDYYTHTHSNYNSYLEHLSEKEDEYWEEN